MPSVTITPAWNILYTCATLYLLVILICDIVYVDRIEWWRVWSYSTLSVTTSGSLIPQSFFSSTKRIYLKRRSRNHRSPSAIQHTLVCMLCCSLIVKSDSKSAGSSVHQTLSCSVVGLPLKQMWAENHLLFCAYIFSRKCSLNQQTPDKSPHFSRWLRGGKPKFYTYSIHFTISFDILRVAATMGLKVMVLDLWVLVDWSRVQMRSFHRQNSRVMSG